jgi:hypothetical protein
LVVWSSSNGLLPAEKKVVDGFFCFVIGILVLFLESLRNIILVLNGCLCVYLEKSN